MLNKHRSGADRQEATKLDWSLLDSIVRETLGNSSAVKFSLYSLKTLLRLTNDEAFDAITDASQDRGVDAIVVDTVKNHVHIFQFKYYESDDHVKRQFPARSVDLSISFLIDLIERSPSLLGTCNKILQNKVLSVWEAIERCPQTISLHFVSNGRTLEPAHKNRLIQALSKYAVTVHEHTARELLASTYSRNADKKRKRLKFIGERTEFNLEGKRMVLGLVSLSELANFVAQPDTPNELDESLFADNVRGVLGMRNDVNKSMFRTIASRGGNDFVFRNNGITIVADQLLYQAGGNFPIELIAPQIVNGCQTVSTAFAARSKNSGILEKGPGQSVLVRIIESKDSMFKEEIALCTNSQTRIYGRDLRAIDDVQLKIERLLRRHGFAYLRKRSDVSDLPRCQTIDMAKLGQLILAYYKQQPEAAKTKSNDIFTDMYDEVFDSQFLVPAKIIAVHTLHYMLEERRQRARDRLKALPENDYSEDWILEGTYHVLFVVSLLSQRDGFDPSDVRHASARLNEAVALVTEFVRAHSGVASYRLFRTVGTAEKLETMVGETGKRRKDRAQMELFK